jgi:hypothetical protein
MTNPLMLAALKAMGVIILPPLIRFDLAEFEKTVKRVIQNEIDIFSQNWNGHG